jgi:hypothetical protein
VIDEVRRCGASGSGHAFKLGGQTGDDKEKELRPLFFPKEKELRPLFLSPFFCPIGDFRIKARRIA